MQQSSYFPRKRQSLLMVFSSQNIRTIVEFTFALTLFYSKKTVFTLQNFQLCKTFTWNRLRHKWQLRHKNFYLSLTNYKCFQLSSFSVIIVFFCFVLFLSHCHFLSSYACFFPSYLYLTETILYSVTHVAKNFFTILKVIYFHLFLSTVSRFV